MKTLGTTWRDFLPVYGNEHYNVIAITRFNPKKTRIHLVTRAKKRIINWNGQAGDNVVALINDLCFVQEWNLQRKKKENLEEYLGFEPDGFFCWTWGLEFEEDEKEFLTKEHDALAVDCTGQVLCGFKQRNGQWFFSLNMADHLLEDFRQWKQEEEW